MNTRTFLLSEMAQATNLPDFFMAYRALQNYNKLLLEESLPKSVPTPAPPQGGFASEPADDEKMPWEGL